MRSCLLSAFRYTTRLLDWVLSSDTEDRGTNWYKRKCGSLCFFYTSVAQVKKPLTDEINPHLACWRP